MTQGETIPSEEASVLNESELSSPPEPQQLLLSESNAQDQASDLEIEHVSSVTNSALEQPVSPDISLEVHEQFENYQSDTACTSTPSPSSGISLHVSNGREDAEGTANESVLSEADTTIHIPFSPHEETTANIEEIDPIDPANPPPGLPVVTRQTRSGRTFKVIGEIVYELMSDGSTLRRGSSRRQTVTTIHDLVSTAADLRARWLIDEQRKEILDNLGEEGVDLDEMSYTLHLMDVDPLDLLLYVVFQEPLVTRAQRVERLRREQTAFFKRFENNLLARATLDVILDKYVRGEAPDVSDDIGLLKLIALTDRHTPLELSRPFLDPATNTNIRTVLKELQTLLYNV